MEADAIGTLSNEENIFCHSAPNSVDMTFYLVSTESHLGHSPPSASLACNWHVLELVAIPARFQEVACGCLPVSSRSRSLERLTLNTHELAKL